MSWNTLYSNKSFNDLINFEFCFGSFNFLTMYSLLSNTYKIQMSLLICKGDPQNACCSGKLWTYPGRLYPSCPATYGPTFWLPRCALVCQERLSRCHRPSISLSWLLWVCWAYYPSSGARYWQLPWGQTISYGDFVIFGSSAGQ